MGKAGEQFAVVALAIIGVAIVAVLVSKNAQTSSVIGSIGKAFSQSLGAAIAPVTGNAAGVGFTGTMQ